MQNYANNIKSDPMFNTDDIVEIGDVEGNNSDNNIQQVSKQVQNIVGSSNIK